MNKFDVSKQTNESEKEADAIQDAIVSKFSYQVLFIYRGFIWGGFGASCYRNGGVHVQLV